MKRLAFGFLLIPLIVLAQEAPVEDPEKQEYYVIVEEALPEFPILNSTATKLPELSLWTPASVGVVSSVLFRQQDGVVLGDALKNVSGVNVQTGFGAFDFFTIRGFDSLNSGLVLTDGAPEPEVTFYQLYNVERVEVLKGPGAFLYGGNPLSGTVNLIRKQPLFENLFQAGTSFGHFGTYRANVDANYGKPDADWAFRVNGYWQSSNRFRDEKDNYDVAINPAASWRINDDSDLKINFEYLHNKYQPDSGIPVAGNSILDVPRERSYQSPFDRSEQDIYRTRLDYQTKINEWFTFRNKFYDTVLDWLSQGTLLAGTFPDGFGDFLVIRTLPILDDRQHILGNQAEGIFHFKTGTVSHKFLAGFELNRLADDFTLDVAFLPPIAAFQPVETATEPLIFVPGQSTAGDTRSIVAAPYFADQLELSKKIQVLIGGRLDVLDYEDAVSGTSRNEQKFSPNFGVVYSARSNVSLYFNTGRAFAPPSTLVVGDRAPEESKQIEAGVKAELFDRRIKATAAVYRLERENIAIPDDTGVTRQIGDELSRGFEAEIMGSPAPLWSAHLAYAYNDAELTRFAELVFTGTGFLRVDRSGNVAAFAPRHILNLWVSRAFSNGLTLAGGTRYVSSQFIAEDNVFQIDDYVTVDAAVFYDWQGWRFRVNFKNITDTKYETRGFGSSSVIPADPFAVYAGVDFKL